MLNWHFDYCFGIREFRFAGGDFSFALHIKLISWFFHCILLSWINIGFHFGYKASGITFGKKYGTDILFWVLQQSSAFPNPNAHLQDTTCC